MPLKINLERLEALREGDPGAYEEAREALNALDEIKEVDPLQLYEPAAEKHRRFHGAQTRIKAFLGGNQSGKSTTSIVDDLIQAVDRECVPERVGERGVVGCAAIGPRRLTGIVCRRG